jgi:hypothetical protein
VAREYGEEKWPAVERLVERAFEDEGPEPRMCRVLARLYRDEWYQGDAANTIQEAIVDGRHVHSPRSVTFGGFQHYVTEATLGACDPEPELVVELGSGWGRNLFSVWLASGPPGATYVGAEYTGAGRRAAARIAALEPALRFESIPFDYHSPDLSALPRVGRAVVITVHSVEQIPHVRPEVIESIRGLAGDVECLQFEPVGWQVGDADRAGSSQEHAEAHDYNRNLLSLLREAEAREEIEIVAVDPEVVGAGTFLNATTLVHWRATRA